MPIDRVNLDKICDYIPVVSSYTNIIDLIQKRRFEKDESEARMEAPPLKEKYVTYIENKSDIRCAILIVPVLGNALVGIYDLAKAFISLFSQEEEEEQKSLSIGAPTGFKPVSGAKKKEEEGEAIKDSSGKDFNDLENQIKEKGELLRGADNLKDEDIYNNPP